MGSWNETCVLSRMPIRAGMPVVALTTIIGPQYETADQTNTALLFGLPVFGTYDDYGGVENVINPAVASLNDTAFGESGYYRRLTVKEKYLGTRTRWLAAHPDTLWVLSNTVAPLFYDELGMLPADIKSYEPDASSKRELANKRATAALAQLGSLLGAVDFSDAADVQENQIFTIFQQVFGPLAWPAWLTLKGQGLFAGKTQMLMHRDAYQAVVADMGARKVGFFQEAKKVPMRSFLASVLDEWLAAYPEALAKTSLLYQGARCNKLFGLPESERYLKPMSSLWLAPKHPLLGHYWGGATPDQVMAAASRDELLDFFVFQWARAYLRLPLQVPNNGSQCEEWQLMAQLHKAAVSALKADGSSGKDFSGTLHR